MLRILATALFALLLVLTGVDKASAQQAVTIDTCGTLPTNLDLSNQHTLYMNKIGQLCVSGTGGGGGGAITAASGAFASGALASGSVASGAMVDLGSQADAACGTDTGNCSAIALIKRGNQTATTTATAVQAVIPSQSPAVPVGGFGLCDGANGTTNPCTTVATVKAASTPAAATDKALVVDQRPGTTVLAGADPSSGKGTPTSGAISISTATTTQLIAASGSTVIYVTAWDIIAGGTGNITLQSADTGGACANPVALTGAYPLTAQAGIAKGNGGAMVLKTPSGKALCALTSAAVQMSGSVTYQQF